jgi:hypothetical protein
MAGSAIRQTQPHSFFFLSLERVSIDLTTGTLVGSFLGSSFISFFESTFEIVVKSKSLLLFDFQ